MNRWNEYARAFLAGEALTFEEADRLWKELKRGNELSLARRVLERIRGRRGLLDKVPPRQKRTLFQQEALLTSKDPELSTAIRHDRALNILYEGIGDLNDSSLDTDAETLGIAGGILKRRWGDLGQIEDLRKAARLYERGATNALGNDAYTQINAAFLDDMLAQIGDDSVARRQRAAVLRERILRDLPILDEASPHAWFNTATRAEALFGLRRYAEATDIIASFRAKPAPWELETTARQLANIAPFSSFINSRQATFGSEGWTASRTSVATASRKCLMTSCTRAT